MGDRGGYYVGIPIKPNEPGFTHVTIALRQDCEPEQLQMMVDAMKNLVLPIVMVIDQKVDMFGQKNDIPVHHVRFPDYHMASQIASFYERFYKPREDDANPHTKLVAHVSVDKEEREKVVNALLERDSGVYVAKRIELKKIGDKEVIFSVDK
jgi:2'-5' RNA ligase